MDARQNTVIQLIETYKTLTSVDNIQSLLDIADKFNGKCFNKRFIEAINNLPAPQGYQIHARLTEYNLEIEYYYAGKYSEAVITLLHSSHREIFTDIIKKRINGEVIKENIKRNANSYRRMAENIEEVSRTITERIEKYNNLLHEAENVLNDIPYQLQDIYHDELYRPALW